MGAKNCFDINAYEMGESIKLGLLPLYVTPPTTLVMQYAAPRLV